MSSSVVKESEEVEELKWVEVGVHKPDVWEKAKTKFLSNPIVPIGCVATITALILGLKSLSKGDSRKQQLMMRYRVGAQGITIIALAVGLLFQKSP